MGKPGRKPQDLSLFVDILNKAQENGKVYDPMEKLAVNMSLTNITVRKYLDKLAEAGVVELFTNGQGHIEYLRLTDKPLPSPVLMFQSPRVIPPKKAAVQSKLTAAILVDFDNVFIQARQEEIKLSFSRLKEKLRSACEGHNILFADAFISPTTNQPGIIASLWKAGFDVIACPMATKDRDSVDIKIRNRVMSYLYADVIDHILVVSRDSDFSDLPDKAADLSKVVKLYNITLIIHQLEGEDAITQLSIGRKQEACQHAIERLREKKFSTNLNESRLEKFIQSILSTIYDRERQSPGKKTPFKTLQQYIWGQLSDEWHNHFNEDMVRSAMTAMIDLGVLHKNLEENITHYRLNPKDLSCEHLHSQKASNQ